MRSALGVIPCLARSSVAVAKEVAAPRSSRFFSDGKGRVLSEEERAAETIYIQVHIQTLSSPVCNPIDRRGFWSFWGFGCVDPWVENGEGEAGETEEAAGEREGWGREGTVVFILIVKRGIGLEIFMWLFLVLTVHYNGLTCLDAHFVR